MEVGREHSLNYMKACINSSLYQRIKLTSEGLIARKIYFGIHWEPCYRLKDYLGIMDVYKTQ